MAAALAMNGRQMTLIFPDEAVGSPLYPARLARNLNALFRSKGVEVVPGARAIGCESRDGTQILTIRGVESGRERTVFAEGVIAGIGVEPNVELARAAGLEVRDGIRVDASLRTSHPDIFAAGDVASVYNAALDAWRRVEHADNANSTGGYAAHSTGTCTVRSARDVARSRERKRTARRALTLYQGIGVFSVYASERAPERLRHLGAVHRRRGAPDGGRDPLMIATKRVYEPYSRADGYRVLVDRLWPRGLSKAKAHVNLWAKDIAPSTELRQWYEHDSDKWPEFQERYRAELAAPQAKALLAELVQRARTRRVTLVYSSHAGDISNAAVLERMLKRRVAAARARRG